jgi:sulfur carrier protein ThiS
MLVHVQLFSRLREHLPAEARGSADIDLPAGATIQHLLDRLGITTYVKLIDVNGSRETDRTRTLCDGDNVRIFPFVVGG